MKKINNQERKKNFLTCKPKKAQTEMMGLVIIVILITIGFFFATSMKQPESEKTPIVVYSDEQLSANFIITLLETQVKECHTTEKITVRDLAIDCVRKNVTSQQQYDCQEGKTSCEVLYNITETITNETLHLKNNFELLFNYGAPGKEEIALLNITEGGGCPGIRTNPGFQAVPLFKVVSGNSYFELYVC